MPLRRGIIEIEYALHVDSFNPVVLKLFQIVYNLMFF